MKVLIIHNKYSHIGGEDTVVQNEFNLLKNNGIQVELCYFSNDTFIGFKGKIFSPISTIYNFKSAKKLDNLFSNNRPDVIHVHNLFYSASPSILYIAKKHKIPVIMTIHNYRLICPSATLLRNNNICELCTTKFFAYHSIKYKCFQDSYLKTFQLSSLIAIHKIIGTWRNYVDQYIFLTSFAKDKFVSSSFNIPTDKLTVKPNFVMDYGYDFNIPREKFFLFVGRLSKEKGIDFLLDAFSKTNLQLEIIGDGPLLQSVLHMCQNHPNIVYSGRRDASYIRERMKICTALLFPSIWYEGLPMTILEAFSSGTPVIATNINNINEIVKNGYNGHTFKQDNKEEFIEKLHYYIIQQRFDLYINARATYDELYSPDDNFSQLIKIYNDAINHKIFNVLS
ncbi:glycosyltransferase family 4 protein [Larkinella bovis]|uniref:Glycosyltransferase family 4 protein n=1 Tax=Larkinella bovis TaxID=683041 RepID=A0ABW0IJI2_9BACT